MNKVLIILIIGLLSCNENPIEQIDDPKLSEDIDVKYGFKSYEFDIQDLEYNRLPYTGYELISLDISPTDSNGVILYKKFGKLYYHPVILSEHIIRFIDCYIRTNNKNYLDYALAYSNKLIEIANEYNGALYFPYNFELVLHDIPGEVLVPSWYSGMAQGEFYHSVHIIELKKLSEIAGDSYFRDMSDLFYSDYH